MAKRMGAHAAYLSDDPDLEEKLGAFTNGSGIDLVILTANPWPAFRTSVEIVRSNGRVSIVSLMGRGEPPLDFNPLAMEWFYAKGISLIAVHGEDAQLYPHADVSGHLGHCNHVLSLDGRKKTSAQPSLLRTVCIIRKWSRLMKWPMRVKNLCWVSFLIGGNRPCHMMSRDR